MDEQETSHEHRVETHPSEQLHTGLWSGPRVKDTLFLLLLLVLFCVAYVIAKSAHQSMEAQRALDEGQRLKEAGQYTAAAPFFERVIAIQEAAYGKDHPKVADALNHLAILYMEQGLQARAETLFESALTILEAAFDKDHPDAAVALNFLALQASRDQGLYVQDMTLLERALSVQEAALGRYHPEVARTLLMLAVLCMDQELYERAEPLLERALAIKEAVLGKDHPEVAEILTALAVLYMDQELYERAEPLLERALAVEEVAFGIDHPKVATTLNRLAGLYMDQGFYERAEPFLERAIAILDATLGKSHPDVANMLTNLALIRIDQQRLAEALPFFAQALTASEAYLRQEVHGISEARLARLLDQLRSDEERLYELVRAHPDNAQLRQLALTAALLRKCRSVEEVANTSFIIYRNLGQQDRETFGRLLALRTQLADLALSGPGTLPTASHQQHLKALAGQVDALEADLARRSAPLRALRALPSASELVDRVAAALPKDGALVELVAYSDTNPDLTLDAAVSETPSQLRYLVLLLFADGSTRALDLGPAERIDRAALLFHKALARRDVSYQGAAQALYEHAFRPLVPLLGKVRRLFLSPDGQLSLVPFAALHDGRNFLIEDWDITYLTSGKDLLPRPEDAPPARSVVVLADPDFNASSAEPSPATEAVLSLTERSFSLNRLFSSLRTELADQSWLPLPGTRREAEAIHRVLPQARLLLGSAATKDALLTLPTPGILHIATHGFFLKDPDVPSNGRAVGHFGTLGNGGSRQLPTDPLLRSGLVLAGAHSTAAEHGSRHRESSLVTALELTGLDLWGTQLVVLSACDTGRGEVRLGQGIFGLRRALAVAGAQTLVTSLWKINDEATSELMEAYYRNLLSGQGRASALREAMRAFRRKQPHPHFWAPFIALGVDAPLEGVAPR